MTTGSGLLGAMEGTGTEDLRAEAANLNRAAVCSHLATTGVLSNRWMELLLISPSLTPAERNNLMNKRLSLMGEQTSSSTSSPIPTFGRRPAHSRPQDPGLSHNTNTEGSGD